MGGRRGWGWGWGTYGFVEGDVDFLGVGCVVSYAVFLDW